MRHTPERGFTLVELLLVLLVIAILIAVAVPSFLAMRERGADATAQANLRALAPAAAAYYNDNGTYAGMSIGRLRRRYDPGLPRATYRMGRLTASSYCVETTAGGRTWNRTGPAGVVAAGACP